MRTAQQDSATCVACTTIVGRNITGVNNIRGAASDAKGQTLQAKLIYPTKPPAMTRSTSPPRALALLAAVAVCLVCAPAPSAAAAAAVTAAVAGGSDAPPSSTTEAKQEVLAALCDNPLW